MILRDKNIVLGVCGGIAAYKSVELLRLLVKQGAKVRVIMTDNARWFVGATTFEALSDQPVCSTLFEEGSEASIRHIDWARVADAVVIAPATANIIGKLANGVADDALSTLMLAVTCPVMICPSMNTHMYESPAVKRNLDTLAGDGKMILNPDSGELACGTTGPGRLPDPPEILDRLICYLSPKDFAGQGILVTAGPTREPIDPVRYISNPSSGKMGFAIARAAEHRGAKVVLVTGPTGLRAPFNVDVVRVQTAKEMAAAVFEHMATARIIIKTAAVSDYRPKAYVGWKEKKGEDEKTLTLKKNEDILRELGKRKQDRILVGFAAETAELEKNATAKLTEKNLDIIVGNIVGSPDSGFESDTNTVTLFYRGGKKEALPNLEKGQVAHELLDRVASLLEPGNVT
jgi:phosphopantothenoylcysteine decarboxylase/phosphopantothenate--cysteine ligase